MRALAQASAQAGAGAEDPGPSAGAPGKTLTTAQPKTPPEVEAPPPSQPPGLTDASESWGRFYKLYLAIYPPALGPPLVYHFRAQGRGRAGDQTGTPPPLAVYVPLTDATYPVPMVSIVAPGAGEPRPPPGRTGAFLYAEEVDGPSYVSMPPGADAKGRALEPREARAALAHLPPHPPSEREARAGADEDTPPPEQQVRGAAAPPLWDELYEAPAYPHPDLTEGEALVHYLDLGARAGLPGDAEGEDEEDQGATRYPELDVYLEGLDHQGHSAGLDRTMNVFELSRNEAMQRVHAQATLLLGEVELIPAYRTSLEQVRDHTSPHKVNHGRGGYRSPEGPLSGDLLRRAPFPWPHPGAMPHLSPRPRHIPEPPPASAIPGDVEGLLLAERQEAQEVAALGTLGYLRGEARYITYLARGCNTFKVRIGEQLTGVELYNHLRGYGGRQGKDIWELGWEAPRNNRIGYGFASGAFGRRPGSKGTPWALTVADFPFVTLSERDNWRPERGQGRSGEPPVPSRMEEWVTQAHRQIRHFQLVYGEEHGEGQRDALAALIQRHDEDPSGPPLTELQSIWEELNWRWWEELRREFHTLRLELQVTTLSMPEFAMYALAPDGNGQARAKMPKTFDLSDPGGPYLQVILPQLQRRAEVFYWTQGPPRQPKAGTAREHRQAPPQDRKRAGGDRQELLREESVAPQTCGKDDDHGVIEDEEAAPPQFEGAAPPPPVAPARPPESETHQAAAPSPDDEATQAGGIDPAPSTPHRAGEDGLDATRTQQDAGVSAGRGLGTAPAPVVAPQARVRFSGEGSWGSRGQEPAQAPPQLDDLAWPQLGVSRSRGEGGGARRRPAAAVAGSPPQGCPPSTGHVGPDPEVRRGGGLPGTEGAHARLVEAQGSQDAGLLLAAVDYADWVGYEGGERELAAQCLRALGDAPANPAPSEAHWEQAKGEAHPAAGRTEGSAAPPPPQVPEWISARARGLTPRTRAGLPLCWGYASHDGCQAPAGTCPGAHQSPLPSWDHLDRAVQLELARRGGHREEPRLEESVVAPLVVELLGRGGEAEDGTQSDPPGAGGGTHPAEAAQGEYGWFLPQAEREGRLEDYLAEPDWDYLEDHHEAHAVNPQGDPEDEEEASRAREMKRIDSLPELISFQEGGKEGPPTQLLITQVKNRYLTAASAKDPQPTLEEVLQAITAEACRHTCAEAADLLDQLQPAGRGGQSPSVLGGRAYLSATHWEEEDYGRGSLHREGGAWDFLDLKDELPLGTENPLSQWLGIPDGGEKKQCILLSAAAATRWARDGQPPPREEAVELALEMREDMLHQAWEALSVLGEPEPTLTRGQADLRIFAHDAVSPHHDKDYRSLIAFPPKALADMILGVLIMDYGGRIKEHRLIGRDCSTHARTAWILIHRGHARAVAPPRGQACPPPGIDNLLQGTQEPDRLMDGWELWDRQDGAVGPLVTAKTYLKCPQCDSDPKAREAAWRAGQWIRANQPQLGGEITAALGRGHPLVWLQQRGLLSDPTPLGAHPAFRWGPRLKEVFAGSARLTVAAQREGIPTDPPVELYEDPLRSRGRQEHNDVLINEVRQRLLKEADAPPGPDVANLWVFENPCTSFCDHQTAGGTRTWDHPEGTGERDIEVEGNIFAEFACACGLALHKRGKGFLLENQPQRNIYPKIYDLPCFQEFLRVTQAVILQGSMCAWGLRPSDVKDPTVYYKKDYWLVASANLAPFLLGLNRPCPGLSPGHQHLHLTGNVPGSSVKRTKEAAQYPHRFVKELARSLRRATALPPTHPAGGGTARAGELREEKGKPSEGAWWEDGREEAAQAGSGKGAEPTTEENGRENPERLARELCLHCDAHKEYSAEAIKGGVRIGDALIRATQSWESAIVAFRKAWTELKGNNLEGACGEEVSHLIDGDLRKYLCAMVKSGVPARQPLISVRVPAKPHESVRGHMDEAMEKLWKDARKGRVLLCGEASAPHLAGVLASPWGRVPKLNPDRTVSDEGRFIHDQRRMNETGHKYDHPPALQPRHRALAREILWWKQRHPGVEIRIAKRDIAEAFRWIWLKTSDAGLFATELPGRAVGVEGNVIAIYLVLTFGWIGSPGEYMAFGNALKQYHDRHQPEDPTWHDSVPHHSHLLMDDDVLIEPMLGRRPWMAGRLAERGARLVFGPDAINAEKKDEEGQFATSQICWGLHVDTARETVKLPEAKVGKLQLLLADAAYAHGNKDVTLREVQVLRGTLNFAVVACPALKPELGAVDRMMRRGGVPPLSPALPQDSRGDGAGGAGPPPQEGGDHGPNGAGAEAFVHLEGAHEEIEKAWDEWWEALETFRVYASVPSAWEAHFTAGLRGMLNPRERMALPGGLEELVWTGGDATLERMGAVDWTARVYGVIGTQEALDPFKEAFRDENEASIIAVCELFTFLTLAAERAPHWEGKLVLYVTDNTNTEIWLDKRGAHCRLARHGLRLLQRLEARHHFSVVSAGVWTKHNHSMDLLSRETKEVVDQEMGRLGLTQTDLKGPWLKVLEEYQQGAPLALPDDPDEVWRRTAWQVMQHRKGAQIPRHRLLEGLLLIEFRATMGPYCKAGEDLGAKAAATHPPVSSAAGSPVWAKLRAKGAALVKGALGRRTSRTWVTGSLGKDPAHKEEVYLAQYAVKAGAELVVVDAPWDELLEGMEAVFKATGYRTASGPFHTSHYGDTIERLVRILVAWKGDSEWGARLLDGVRETRRRNLVGFAGQLLPTEAVDEGLVVSKEEGVTLWKRVPVQDPWPELEPPRIWAAGTLTDPQGGHLHFYDPTGPVAGRPRSKPHPLRGHGWLIGDTRLGAETVRRLAPEEVWRMAGGSLREWNEGVQEGADVPLLLTGAARSLPPRTARCILATAARTREGRDTARAGVCPDLDEDHMNQANRVWLAAWGDNPDNPRGVYEAWLRKANGTRAGGPGWSDGDQHGPFSTAASEAGRAGRGRWTPAEREPDPGSVLQGLPRPSDRRARRLVREEEELAAQGAGEAGEGAPPPEEPLPKLNPQPRLVSGTQPQIGGGRFQELRKAAQDQYMLCNLAKGTRTAYATGWKQWTLFMQARRGSPYLTGVGVEGRRRDEDVLLEWVVHQAHALGRTEGTIRTKLMAVRHHHLIAGYPDPLEIAPRLWLALGGIKRMGAKPNRKYPVTLEMLRWIRRQLDLDTIDGAATWAAIVTAFFFMLRASEYLADPGKPWRDSRVLFGRDVTPRLEGEAKKTFAGADEVVVFIRGSKTDQYNFGCCRNHYTTRNELCPVRALEALERLTPERWGEEGDLPLFRKGDGAPITRQEVKGLLESAAIAAGIHPSHVGSHSLRIGGATAMYHAVPDLEKLKRFGRWKTGAFHVYLWEAHEPQKGLAEAMAAQDYQLTIGSTNRLGSHTPEPRGEGGGKPTKWGVRFAPEA